ncbi:MAG: hypothetical protein AAGC77_14460, partial [Pseudomonadota bacterium]
MKANEKTSRSVWSYFPAFLAYVLLSTLIFGNPLKPIYTLLLGAARIPAYIIIPSILSGITTAICAVVVVRKTKPKQFNLESVVFVVAMIATTILFASVITGGIRSNEIRKLQP